MSKHTIELSEEDIRVINVVKAIMDIKSIEKAIPFIIQDYASSKAYLKFIAQQRKAIKKAVKTAGVVKKKRKRKKNARK